MNVEHPRWRIRISTLMLLVIIMALVSALIVERGRKEKEMMRLQTAQAEARRAEAASLKAEGTARGLMQRAMEARAEAIERQGLAEAVLRSTARSEARKSSDESRTSVRRPSSKTPGRKSADEGR
jgi:hypothetical protein